MELREGIQQSAEALGIDPIVLATAISYETAGTFDPTKAGPTTQWGQHRGLIQFGEPQAQRYGVDWNNAMASQLGPNGAVVRYLKDTGVQPGMGLLDVYSAINAGGVGRYNRTDANNGGAPGTVADKVRNQMGGHLANAERLFNGEFTPTPSAGTGTGTVASALSEATGLPQGLQVPHANPTPSYRSTREEQQLLQGQGDVTAWQGLKEAISNEWAGSYMLAQMGADEFKPDTEFRYDEELWGELTGDLPPAYHDIFDDAVSLGHARALRERAVEMVESDQKLAQLGGWGTAMRIGAAVFDPVAIGASVVTDGLAAPAIAAGKVTRAGRALRLGASAGVANAGVEGYIASQDPRRGARSVLIAGATGLVVGGALGAFIPARMDRELETVARDLQREVTRTPGDTQSLGAARVAPEEVNLTAAERQLAAAADAPRSALGGARIDMVGRLKQSEHPVVRRLANSLAEDGVANADGSVLTRAASEEVNLAMKVRMADFYRTAEPAFRDWAKEMGIPLWQRGARREGFFDEVGKAVRRQAGMYTDDVNINKVADAMRSAQADLLRFAKDKGLRGFDDVSENSEYLMRVFNHRALDDMLTRFGEGAVKRMLGKAISRGSPDLDYEDTLTIAQSYLKSIRSQKYQDVQLSRVFSEDQSELLERMLIEGGEVSAENISRIVSAVRKPVDGSEGGIARSKHRLRLDESYRDTYIDDAGVHHQFGVEDFLDNNAERLMTLYTRQITGAGFMEDALSQFRVARLDGEADGGAPSFETIIGHIRETAGQFNMKPHQLDSEINRLETLYKSVLGIPLNKRGNMSESLRFLRDYNFIRVMNQVGFAQIAEIGNILGAAGFRATLQHVPALRGIYKRAANGRMDDDLLDEIESIWGIGTDRLRHTTSNRMDDYGVYEGAMFGRVDNALQKAKHVTADISLMAPVNMALQRMAGRAAIQRWMNDALGDGRGISKSRLAAMGVSEEMATRIKAQMVDHVATKEGVLGRGVKRINLEDWADAEAASTFVNAIDRWSRKIIQENDIGQMSQWMTTDIGRTMMQFRSFMAAAWTKQTLSGVHHRDMETFMMWSMGIMFGGLSYMAQTHINAVGRDDRRQYLKDRLNSAALGRSAFQRAGFATIAPSVVDNTLVYALGYEPVFSYGRTTGLASETFFGNPTFDLLSKAARAGQGASAAMLRGDYDYSQQDMNAAKSLVPFNNAMGIRNAYHLLGQNLPRFSE